MNYSSTSRAYDELWSIKNQFLDLDLKYIAIYLKSRSRNWFFGNSGSAYACEIGYNELLIQQTYFQSRGFVVNVVR